VIALPSVLFMSPRLPVHGPRRLRPMDLGFVKKLLFWTYQCPNMVQSIVAPLPSLWMPAFASSMGMSPLVGPISVALLNLASCGGFLLQGRLVDHYHVSWGILVSTIGSTIAVFGFWGCTTHEAMLYIFAILFGLFGLGYPGHWPGCAGDMRRTSPNVNTGLILSLLCAGKGVGTILAGPVSDAMLSVKLGKNAGLAYGSSYGLMIVFTGICVLLGGAGALPRFVQGGSAAIMSAAIPRRYSVRMLRTDATT
jgi:hypothetical protein